MPRLTALSKAARDTVLPNDRIAPRLHVDEHLGDCARLLKWMANHLIAVDKVEQILPALRALRADEARARRIADGGRALAAGALAWPNVLEYLRALLDEYAARRSEPVAPPVAGDGFARVGSARELMELAAQCRCREPPRGAGRDARSAPCLLRRVPRGGMASSCCDGWDCATRRLGCGGGP